MSLQTLRDFWYPVVFSHELSPYQPYSVTILGLSLVMFRGEQGKVYCVQDSCPHRGFPLSEGHVEQGELECPYHGWRFDGTGRCTYIPTLTEDEKIPRAAQVLSYAAIEREGIIWVWAGSIAADPNDLVIPKTPANYAKFIRYDDFDCHYSLVAQNAVDPAHFFLHRYSIGWMFERPVSSFVWSQITPLSDGFEAEARVVGVSQGASVHYQVSAPIRVSQKGPFPFLDLMVLADYFIVPFSPNKTRGFSFVRIGSDIPQPISEIVLSLFQISFHLGVEEDKKALRSQQKNLDLGMKGGAATSQDRMLLFYERWRQKLDDGSVWGANS